jgi:hypothetical protein
VLPIGFGPPIIQRISRLDASYYAVNAARNLLNGAGLFIRSMREAVG